MDAVRREVQAIDPDQPVFSDPDAGAGAGATIAGGIARGAACSGSSPSIALVLSSVGLYAVMAYAVTQRTQEIGVRMALGAQRWQVSWLILERGLAQLALGLTLGLAGALALGRVLRAGTHARRSGDVRGDHAAPDARLVAACLLPARRATRVDPVVALRAD